MNDSSTNFSLIESLAQGNPASDSWPIFVTKYGRLIYRWCLHWKATPEEAEDVIQETLIAVYRRLETFQHLEKSKFRSWLKTIAYHIWLDFFQASEKARGQITGNPPIPYSYQMLGSIEARDDLMKFFDEMATREILELACKRVKACVEDHHWQCFELSYLKHLPGKQIGQKLQISEGAVFTAISRVRKLIRDEVDRIESA